MTNVVDAQQIVADKDQVIDNRQRKGKPQFDRRNRTEAVKEVA